MTTEAGGHRQDMRLDRLEGVVENLAQNQARLEATMGGVVDNISKLSNSFDSFATAQANSNRTNWSTMISAGSLILALVVALGTGFVGVPLSNLTQVVAEDRVKVNAELTSIESRLGRLIVDGEGSHTLILERSANQQKEINHNHERLHVLDAKRENESAKLIDVQSRLANVERMIFPDAKYRAGKPD